MNDMVKGSEFCWDPERVVLVMPAVKLAVSYR